MKKVACFVVCLCVIVLFAGCSWGGVPIDEEHFPDVAFRAYIINHFDSNGDNFLSDDEIKRAKEIDLCQEYSEYENNRLTRVYQKIHYVQSLVGIEYLSDLQTLDCENNALVYLDVSQNKALSWLNCSGNRLVMLNLTGCTALNTLKCNGNLLSLLNVSSCTALTYLSCSHNMLESLNLSNCTALETLECNDNYITELDVSNNTALKECKSYSFYSGGSFAKFYSRGGFSSSLNIYGITVRHGKMNEYQSGFYVNLNDYVPNAAACVKSVHVNNTSSYEKVQESGIVWLGDRNDTYGVEGSKYETIKSLLENNGQISMYFSYTNPKSAANTDKACRLHINLYTSEPPKYTNNAPEPPSPLEIQADILEGGANADKIICGFDSYHYFDRNGNALTEVSIAGYSSGENGKMGFVADGNSRLILRVKSNKPGIASFFFPNDSGVSLESLANRGSMGRGGSLEAKELSDGSYQASVIIIAPDGFPEGKKFPSDSFNITVTFKADEKDTQTEKHYGYYNLYEMKYATASTLTKELKIEAVPVLLIPGMFSKATKIYGMNKNSGIWRALIDEGFDANHIDTWDYDGTKGPSQLLAEDGNELYRKIIGMFGQYASKGIVCTKADIVAFGMGGLMATKYLQGDRYDSKDGNNWSIRSYKKGMVRRLITIATPYYGTPWADILLGTVKAAGFSPTFKSASFIADAVLTKLFGTNCFKNMKNALSELTTDRNPGTMPSVYMHAIYGDVSHLLDTTAYAVDLLGDAAIEFGMGLFVTPWAGLAPVMCVVGLGAKFASIGEGLIGALFYEGHDLVVGVSSATASGYLRGSSTGYTGVKAFHSLLAGRDGVAKYVAELLRGKAYSFTKSNISSKALPTERKSTPVSMSASSESKQVNMTEDLRLDISPKVFKATAKASQTVTITATSGKAALEEVYLAIGDDEGCKIFRLSSSDKTGKKFGGKLIFTSQDMGAIKALCFSHNPSDNTGTSLLISNVAQVSATSNEEESTPPEITSATLSNAITNQPYSYQLTTSGTHPITWTLTGRLPAGLTLSESGLISGIPTKAGKSTFTAKATNDYGHDSQKFTLQVYEPVSISTASLKNATIGKNYSTTFKAKGTRQITWSAEGLPDGLTINVKTGRISGRPTTYGIYNAKITATNGAGSLTKNFELTVKGIPPKIAGNLARAELNMNYSSGLRLTAGSSPVVWSIEGTLPDGLTFDSETGIISGTPASYAKSGYKLTITATNDAGSKSRKITLNVKGKAPRITAKIPDAEAGKTYSATLTATGSQPITWSAGDIPSWLAIDGDTISGTPTEAGRFRFTIYASNPVRTARKVLTLRVKASTTEKNTVPEIYPRNKNSSSVTAQTLTENLHMPANISSGIPEGYIIAAEIGEVSCDVPGMYDFEVVLGDEIPEGAELAYSANSESPSDDDSIAEFYDEAGKEISSVPENRRIILSIWLNEGVRYSPAVLVRK